MTKRNRAMFSTKFEKRVWRERNPLRRSQCGEAFDRGGFALALLCFTWRGTVFCPNEWESHVIGYGHGGLLSSLHIVSAYFSP